MKARILTTRYDFEEQRGFEGRVGEVVYVDEPYIVVVRLDGTDTGIPDPIGQMAAAAIGIEYSPDNWPFPLSEVEFLDEEDNSSN